MKKKLTAIRDDLLELNFVTGACFCLPQITNCKMCIGSRDLSSITIFDIVGIKKLWIVEMFIFHVEFPRRVRRPKTFGCHFGAPIWYSLFS